MTTTINDWTPETRSLLDRLMAAGATLHAGDNGEDRFEFDGDLDKFIANLTACDESHLYVMVPGRINPLWIFLVFGNSPGELVCDYTCHEILDVVTDAHYGEWSERKQPTKSFVRSNID